MNSQFVITYATNTHLPFFFSNQVIVSFDPVVSLPQNIKVFHKIGKTPLTVAAAVKVRT